MKVLFLSDRPPQGLQCPDAYHTRIEGLRRGLEALGVQTDLLSLRTLRFRRPHLVFSLNAPVIARRARGFDVVHAPGAGATVAAAAARLRNHYLLVFDVHGDELMEMRLRYQVQPSLRQAYLVFQTMLLAALARRTADTLLMISEPFRQRYRDKGVAPERMVLVRNGVNLSLFQATPPREEGPLRFCYAGSFQSWQAVGVLVDALALNTDDHLHFHLIGFSREDQALKTQIAARLGGHATLEDWLPIEALPQRLRQADVLLIPRTHHPAMQGGLPSKFAEYLAMGRPLIVTNVDETAAFVQQYGCGLVCEPTSEGLGRAIRQAAAWSADERRARGANARRLAETVFDWNIIARDYLDALQAVIPLPED